MFKSLPPIENLLRRILHAQDIAELDALEHECFGRKNGVFTIAFTAISSLKPNLRKTDAMSLNTLKTQALAALRDQRAALGKANRNTLAENPLDLTIDLPPSPRGHLHPIPSFMEELEDVFGRMGFDVAYGPEIETEELQFDLLNFPREHAARDAQDIFYLSLPAAPGNRWLLRGHTSPVQIRYMRTHTPPFRMICPGKVYRKDDDATHSPMFHQVEGMMIDRDISLANMKAVMIAAVQELISPETEFRFRTGYFPFVEPGLEMDMRWRNEGEWMEIAGCGMAHPNVLANCGIDPKSWQGFAFGFGVERMIMIRDGIPDIRLFFENDPRFLEQF
ncbi:phenylalanine--tRNA ligase subunit alpha [Candidatus Peribacteria bacterium RIFCSPLOWO2_12_FULL_55_15]|nr:MAG: phenylalanine--tRNA ligase subunit alpha [Candidatus Peribacteria bacterium RIFCSPHIGHO2_02_FULL_55_24]OGJ64306.1 MAG: phenylalanine--tRNA ligase subunit alpha [Candidatus Peribacteria bacterium RIFCSPHIGHO2_12_FULL_54_10]OGJ67342.1 MAG: phenylalanine--tRNA ligase subunit alpha [Candidatus Peribacteria bacterium RIFCSPLOWO2_01_FULL_54_110]OGJ68742.1 MAG: phenylalanine--tRNA ligase subunit alpha [Candidatus Peribacteria bacterium RIFCSPLOWO2_02_FULL_55_36]OGJ71238.1 MAG: phenylalanine--t